MNDFSKISSETDTRDLARHDCREIEPALTPEEVTERELANEERLTSLPMTWAGEPELPYDGGGWPGDGSGTDDFADYNANEAMDYSNE